MGDLLVRLYDLPDMGDLVKNLSGGGIIIRRAMSFESRQVAKWVEDFAGERWAMQAEAAFYNSPISCYIAIKEDKILGFALYDATCKNFFGPTAVDESYRGKGIGKALLLSALQAMRNDGYAYAIIGGAGPVEYYTKALDAQVIDKSTPGIYANRLPV